jgi:hypothetical protein
MGRFGIGVLGAKKGCVEGGVEQRGADVRQTGEPGTEAREALIISSGLHSW